MGFFLFALFHCREADDFGGVCDDLQGAVAEEASGDEDLVEDVGFASVVVGAFLLGEKKKHEVEESGDASGGHYLF